MTKPSCSAVEVLSPSVLAVQLDVRSHLFLDANLMKNSHSFAVVIAAASFASLGSAGAANIVTIDFDTNPGYAYGFNEFYGYGSPNSGGNQAENAWGMTATTPFSDTTGEFPGVGVGGSDGLQAAMDSSDLVTAALEDANSRFGDSSLNYTYWGGSLGTGANPSAISTTNLAELIFSIDASFEGAESMGGSLRVDAQFQGGSSGDILLRYDIAIDPTVTGFNTYTIPLSNFTVQSGSAGDIAQDFTNINFNLQAEGANSSFGYDNNNVISVDNLAIDQQIPEPSTTGFVVICSAFLALRRRR